MKLINIKLINFKKLSSVPCPTITFNSDINVLVGSNNAGKTSILKAIQKLFRTEGIDPMKDLNYLVKDGNLIIEAAINITSEQWISYLRIALGQNTNIPIDAINTHALGKVLYHLPIKLIHNVSFVSGKQSNYEMTGELNNEDLKKVATDKNTQRLVTTALYQLAKSDFYNVYKTPLYLDSKGEIKEYETFKPLSQIESNRNNKEIDIRGLLYALKKKDPEQFASFKKRLLEIFTELNDIDVVHNEELGRFELVLHEKLNKNGDTQNVIYDIKNVGEGMQSLVKMFSSILLHKPSIVLMDEPEAHMHPGLIREFVKYIKLLSAEIQFIITTHSVVLINEVGLDKVFSLKNEVDQKGIIATKVDDRNKFLEAINSLGYNVDTLTYTIKPSVFVFTEGINDKDLILAFAHKAGLGQQINTFSTAFVAMGGKGNRYKLANLIDKLNKEFIDSPVIMILDKDETPPGQVKTIRSKYFSENPKRLHYFSKRQIENYLIDTTAIKKLIAVKVKSAELMDEWAKFNIDKKVLDLVDRQKETIYNRYIREIFIGETFISTLELTDIIKSLSSLPLNEGIKKFLGIVTAKTAENAFDLTQKTNTALQEFDNIWSVNKLEMCDGRELLKALKTYIADNYKISFTLSDIIDSMDKIPDEISTLLNQLTKPEELRIQKKG